MKILFDKIKGESGQAMVLIAVTFIFLCGMVGLAVDVGNITVQRGDLQISTDAAALAGSQDLPGDPTAARAAAIANATANGISNPTITIDQNSITVVSQKTIPTYFMSIFGANSSSINVRAKAVSGIANSVPWIVPFVIPQPPAFNYDSVYVMRMYGSGPYPYGYDYPQDYKTDAFFKDYPLNETYIPPITTYTIKQTDTVLNTLTYDRRGNVTGVEATKNPKLYFDAGVEVDLVGNITISGNKYLKVTGPAYKKNSSGNVPMGENTGYILETKANVTTIPGYTKRPYPYQFDYMNVNILSNSTTAQYTHWLEFGYHEKFTVGDTMYYKAPSTGGQPSVDAFARRVSRDSNTDYTKAKVGDGRVILIPVVQSLLPRTTREGTHLTVLGFAAFFIQEVHKNSPTYGTSFWFEGRFLENITVDSDDVTFDPNADYGVRVTKLIYE